ncbi:hypothetical protein EJ110_NYTH33898 [Nymphaea thermarum]|nr:hypothetical protein EJ110_NYTH33898 [Nymphaea thermarum]
MNLLGLGIPNKIESRVRAQWWVNRDPPKPDGPGGIEKERGPSELPGCDKEAADVMGTLSLQHGSGVVLEFCPALHARCHVKAMTENHHHGSAFLLVAGFGALLAGGGVAGLYMILVALTLMAAVNVHDLVAHLISLDFRLPLMGLDVQFLTVELASPLVQFVGCHFAMTEENSHFLMQIEKKRKLEKHASTLLIAGPALWLVGSIQNACQVYERADGLLQVLQKGVYLPFLMGSQLLLVAGILNRQIPSHSAHDPSLLGRTWAWLGLSGSLLYFIGGLANVRKVFKMQRLDWTRLEQLRGVRREGWWRESEIRTPLVAAEQRTVSVSQEGGAALPPSSSSSYKVALAAGQP